MIKESYLYTKLGKKVQCQTCAHRCVILPARNATHPPAAASLRAGSVAGGPNQRGICGVRENQNGKLYFLVYGQAAAVQIDPIEKKPLFHFLPGSKSFSIAAVGCNLKCLNCQNWQISQASKNQNISSEQIQQMGLPAEARRAKAGENWPPEKIVEEALKNRCPSISYTYTEPTIFLEYALDTMKIARKNGLKNIWVTNGFMTPETLKMIGPYLDAVNVDLKSLSDDFYQKVCGARLQPILDNLKTMKKMGIWIEITTLVIPTLSDKIEMFERIAQFIKNELGEETPWHITRFSPELSWQLQNLPETSIEILKKARDIGLKAGLKHVYNGNIF